MRPGTLRRLRAALLSPERRRGEQGYVLGVVLVAMMIGLSLITALLGLSFTTQRAAITQQELARERRAADGALEVAVEEIRSNYSPGDPLCDPVLALGTVAMDLGGEASDEVTLKCGDILDPTPNAAGDVKVVGDDAPSLQHAGGSALGVVGAITVWEGAQFAGTADPALRVAGNYTQANACGAATDLILDADRGPECDASLPDPPSVSDKPPPLTPSVDVPDGCPSGPLPAGRYDAASVADLNDRFQTCAEVNFAKGDYWFDGTLTFTGADVFIGSRSPTGGCGDRGASIWLAGGVGITHSAGEVVICGSLLQSSQSDLGPVLTDAVSTEFTNPEFALAIPDPVGQRPTIPRAGYAEAQLAYGWETLEATIRSGGQSELSSLSLRWSSEELPNAIGTGKYRTVWVEVLNKDGSLRCSTSTAPYLQRGRTNLHDSQLGSELLLTDSAVGCEELVGLSQSQLDSMRVRVHFWQDYGDGILRLKNLHLVANQVTIPARTASSDGPRPWTGVDGVLDKAGGKSSVAGETNCQYLGYVDVCQRNPSDPASSLTLKNLEVPAVLGIGSRITSLVLAIDVAIDANWDNKVSYPDLDSSTTGAISVEVGDGTLCSAGGPDVRANSYSRSKRTYFLDLSSCIGRMNVAQFSSTDITVTVSPEKTRYIEEVPFYNAGLELPTLDYVRLIATTNTVNDTVDIAAYIDEANGSSFRVYGDTTLPRANLAVKWAGTATAEALFNGDLIVRSVNSTQTGAEVGVLCCGPMSPTIRVNAYTDAPPDPDPVAGNPGVIRGTARIRLDLAAGGDTTVTVADWQLCHLDGCKLNDTVLPP